VVPAYNEEATIGAVVRELLSVLPAVAIRGEVIVVDDGSQDGTAPAVDRIAATESRVRLIRHTDNRGYGAALRSGLGASREPWCFFVDGDGQFEARELVRLVAAAPEADVVAGYRAPRADVAMRRFCGWSWSWLMRRVLAVPVRDVNCAFKLVRREVLGAVELESAGALVNAELLGKAARRGFRVREVPVTHRPRRHGRATGVAPRVVLQAFRELVALAGRIRAIGVSDPRLASRVGIRRGRVASVVRTTAMPRLAKPAR
jgi:glycosyltransferase involved in cell wall biosynthesis